MQYGFQIRQSSSDEIGETLDLSTIAYIEVESLFFFGTPLPMEMIGEWFGNETTFIELANQNSEAVLDWLSKISTSLSTAITGNIALDRTLNGAGDELTDFSTLADVLLTAWEAAYGSTQLSASVTAATVAGTASYVAEFSTYIDGAQSEILRDITFDSAGNMYVTGGTEDFRQIPITPGNDYYDTSGIDSGGSFTPHDVFVQKYYPSGNLLWSTRIGGNNYDRAYGIEVDDQGSVYIAGRAGGGFYVTPGVYQETFGRNTPSTTNKPYGKEDGFVSKLDAATGQLDWSTYIGGQSGEFVRDLDVDANGVIHLAMAYVLNDVNQPITADALQPSLQGTTDNIYAQLSNDGTTLLYGTYIGGGGDQPAAGTSPSIIVDAFGDINMIMRTDSVDAFTTPGAFRTTVEGKTDFYVVKFDGATDGRTIKAATYFGTKGADHTETHQLAIDDAGNFIVAGETNGSILPSSATGFQSVFADGGTDGFISVISADATQALASTYYGGSGRDNIEGIFLTDAGIFVSGTTQSRDLQVTDTSQFGGYHGGEDAFVALFSHDLSQLLYASYVGGGGNDQGRALAVSDNGEIAFGGLTTSSNFFLQSAANGHLDGGSAAFLTKLSPGSLVPPPPLPPPGPMPHGSEIEITASAQLYKGSAAAWVKVDGDVVGSIDVTAGFWQGQTNTFTIDTGIYLDGSQTVEVEYYNDLQTSTGNRDLFIHDISIGSQDMLLRDAEITASVGRYLGGKDIIQLGTNGAAVFHPTAISSQETEITLIATSNPYHGAAEADVLINGNLNDTIAVSARIVPGERDEFVLHYDGSIDTLDSIEVVFNNDYSGTNGDSRNLYIDQILINGAELDESLVSVDSNTGFYDSQTDMTALLHNGSAFYDFSLQTGILDL